MKSGGRRDKEGKAFTATTSHEAGLARAMRELKNPQGEEGPDASNLTSSV